MGSIRAARTAGINAEGAHARGSGASSQRTRPMMGRPDPFRCRAAAPISASGHYGHNAGVRQLVTIVLLLFVLGCASRAHTQPAALVGVLGITSEIVPVEKRVQDGRDVTVRGFVFRQGTIGGRPVVVGRTGTGKVNAAIAATVLIGHFSPAAMFFSGTAGAVDPALAPGDVVIGTAVAHHDIGQQTPDGLQRRGPRHPSSSELDSVLLSAPDSLVDAARRATRALALPPITTGDSTPTPRIVEGLIVTGEMFVANVAQREDSARISTPRPWKWRVRPWCRPAATSACRVSWSEASPTARMGRRGRAIKLCGRGPARTPPRSSPPSSDHSTRSERHPARTQLETFVSVNTPLGWITFNSVGFPDLARNAR